VLDPEAFTITVRGLGPAVRAARRVGLPACLCEQTRGDGWSGEHTAVAGRWCFKLPPLMENKQKN
jgi:hypothetical protein